MEESGSRVHVLPPIPRNFSFKNLRKLEVAGLSPEQEPPKCTLTRPEKPQVERDVFPGEAANVADPPSPRSPPPNPSAPTYAPSYAPIIAPAIGHTIAPAMVPAFPFLHGQRQHTHHGASVPARHTHMGIGIPVIPDPRFGTEKIMGLNLYNFHNFTMDNEKALVLFYNTKCSTDCGIKQQFELAAEKWQDQNRAFGAVDCFLEKELCCREKICSTPMFKLYSNGFPVSSINDTSRFNAYQMHLLIKMTPVFAQPRNVTSKQPARPRVIMGTRMLRRQPYGV